MYMYTHIHTHIYNPKCNFLVYIVLLVCMYVNKFQIVNNENMHTSNLHTYMPTYS